MVNLFTGMINLEYERINSVGRGAIVAGLLINSRPNDLDNLWYDGGGILRYFNYSPHFYFFRLGYNFYPFNHSLIRTTNTRVSSGFSLLLGSYRSYLYYQNLDMNISHGFASSLMWNFKWRYYFGNHWQLAAGVEVSVLPVLTFFCPQLTLSAGF